MPIVHYLFGRNSFPRLDNRESSARSAFRPFMTACVSRHCRTGWNRSSSRCSMPPASDIDEEDRQRMLYARSGKRSKRVTSGSWMRIFPISLGLWTMRSSSLLLPSECRDGRVLRLIRSMLKAGCMAEGRRLPTEQGAPQGGVVSPILSNVLLTPFDREMRHRGYRLTRYADDWVVTCCTKAEAQKVLAEARMILTTLGVTLNVEKTRIVHVAHGFEFLGYKIKRGSRPLALPSHKIRTGVRKGDLYAYPRQKSLQHFKDQIRRRTCRKAPVSTQQLIDEINPVIRGWGLYYHKAHVRKLFARLDRWILRRIWSHRFKRWRCRGWKQLPERQLYDEMGLVRFVFLIPSIKPR